MGAHDDWRSEFQRGRPVLKIVWSLLQLIPFDGWFFTATDVAFYECEESGPRQAKGKGRAGYCVLLRVVSVGSNDFFKSAKRRIACN